VSPTRRIYWEEPYRVRFNARVLGRLRYEGRPAVVMDATCFYPTSGGQPHDVGDLGEARVLDVLEEDGRIIHVLDREIGGEILTGEIDWARRFDHMQQHTGQHILSAAFHRVLSAPTVSFHLGQQACTIDLERQGLTQADVSRVEDAANRVVFADGPVDAREYAEADLKGLGLRREPTVRGRVRVVTVQDCDASACGGTHVRSAGEVGPIHVRGWEKRRGHTRVEFLCGWRAVRAMRSTNAILQETSSLLSVGVDEVCDAVVRLIEAEREARRERESLAKDLLSYRAAALAAQAQQVGGIRMLSRVLDDCDAAGMRFLAQHLIQRSGMMVFLAVEKPSPQVVFARSADVEVDMAVLLKAVLGAHGGRGGGSPHVAQGGGVDAAVLPGILEEARNRACTG